MSIIETDTLNKNQKHQFLGFMEYKIPGRR